MNERKKPESSTSGRVSGREMADALADVMKDQNEKAASREVAGARAERRTSPVTWVAFLLLSAFSGYLWLGSPSWLQPETPNPVTPALHDAGLRMEIYNQALLVESFKGLQGRLPNSLAEAGDPFTVVQYERLDGDRYRLIMTGEGEALEYRSGDPLLEFLGDAPRVIEEGG